MRYRIQNGKRKVFGEKFFFEKLIWISDTDHHSGELQSYKYVKGNEVAVTQG